MVHEYLESIMGDDLQEENLPDAIIEARRIVEELGTPELIDHFDLRVDYLFGRLPS